MIRKSVSLSSNLFKHFAVYFTKKTLKPNTYVLDINNDTIIGLVIYNSSI